MQKKVWQEYKEQIENGVKERCFTVQYGQYHRENIIKEDLAIREKKRRREKL